jgi:omega-6 fatty acid desaturase (delta-12 desaturase)
LPQRLIQGLRQQLKAFHRWPLGAAIGHLVVRLALYAAAFAGTLAVSSPVLRGLIGVAAGVFSGSLFMIGHDACHGSYTSRPVLNQMIGRIAFLTSYHTYSPWELSHNRIHHVYTNLRNRDFVWAPLSRAELDALPWWKRRLHRAYRTPLGLALYYPIEIWWPRLVFPRRELLDRPRRVYTLDSVLVLGFLAAQLAVIAAASDGWPARAVGVGFALVVPYLTFSWMIGFVIYFNHTHPEVPWFGSRDEWSAAAGAVRGTVRLTFPRWTLIFAPSIMDHVAHHVDPRVPLVRLKEAQERIEAVLPGQIVVQAFGVRALLGILERCKLYDYDAHCWTDFQGAPTTDRLLPERPRLQQAAAWPAGAPAQHAS